jgi:predicted ribonuclease YlaK
LVVPVLVVEELDRLKDRERASKAADRSKRVLKRLRELCGAVSLGHPAPIPTRVGTTIEVLVDDDWHERRPNNDDEIIHQVQYIGALTGKDVTLACVDAAMEFRARSRGVRALSMPLADERVATGGEPEPVAGAGTEAS